MFDLWKKNRGGRNSRVGRKGFTLPEVIVSFSVLVLVIVSATNVLTLVMRTNSDNVDSMLANGLAQEGLESFRFMRDSDAVLGLGFDGSAKSGAVTNVWGEKLMDVASGSPVNFVLLDKTPIAGCDTKNLGQCMPVGLMVVAGDVVDLAKDDKTLVYLVQEPAGAGTFRYLQSSDGTVPAGASATQFHRLLVVQPFKDPTTATEYNVMRVSSMVFWAGAGGMERKVVLTSELTDWK